MKKIVIALHTDNEQRLYLKTDGISLTTNDKERIIDELRDAIQHKLRAASEGTYQFSTPLPGITDRITFNYRKEENPEYIRSSIFVFTAEQDEPVPKSDHSSPGNASVVSCLGGMKDLQAGVGRDAAASDRDARQLALVLEDYQQTAREAPQPEGEVMAFVLDTLVRLAEERDALQRGAYLMALRKLGQYYPSIAKLFPLLEGCCQKFRAQEERENVFENILDRGKRRLFGGAPRRPL